MANSHFPSAGAGTPGGSSTSVQFNDNGDFGGFGSWDGAALTVDGVSLPAEVSPVTLTGGDDGFGDSALVVSVGADDYMGVMFDAGDQVDVYFPRIGTLTADEGLASYIADYQMQRLGATQSWLAANNANGATLGLGPVDTDTGARAVFVLFTSGSTPTAVISQPAGGTLAIVPPSADPHVVGAIWNNAGTLTISAG